MTVRIQKPTLNIREKLAELERPIGINGQALMATDTPQQAFSLIGARNCNLIINGDFKISQRGDFSSATAISSATYYLDRWRTNISGVTATIQRQTVTLPDSTQTYSAKIAATSTVANSYLQLEQYVELFPYIQGRTVTMSAWVRSNRQARLRIGSTSGDYDSLTAHSGSGNWEYITQTLTLGTGLSSLKFGVIFWNSSGGTTGTSTGAGINNGDYIEFANYQVEFGKVATPFEYRNYAQELALCQRYYEKSFEDTTVPANGSNGSSFSTEVGLTIGWAGHRGGYPSNGYPGRSTFARFRVPKRVPPTVSLYGNSNGLPYIYDTTNGARWVTTNWGVATNKEGFEWANEYSNVFQMFAFSHWTASAEL